MKNNWSKELPEGFKQVYCIDAKDKKTSRRMLIGSFLLTVVVMIPFAFDLVANRANINTDNIIPVYIGFIAAMILYTVLHELVHGAVYKIITHQKLTYGMTLTVAFCGVPDLFIKRSSEFYSILAPFVVFNLVYAAALIVMERSLAWYLVAVLFAIHVGGCVGDLWGSLYMATHYKDKTMFVNDTGPKQTFFIKD